MNLFSYSNKILTQYVSVLKEANILKNISQDDIVNSIHNILTKYEFNITKNDNMIVYQDLLDQLNLDDSIKNEALKLNLGLEDDY